MSVAVGQIATLAYHYYRREHSTSKVLIQKAKNVEYEFWEGVTTHLAQPEGFVLLGSYLIGTWMFNALPASYYSLEGPVNLGHVLAQLLVTDAVQTLMHYAEHKVHRTVYQKSHKPHHVFRVPRLFDAFNGSMADTILMILLPLYITANVVHCNVWSYMAFGTVYANYLTLIHSEYAHPWDKAFRALGVATAGDHHVHHSEFVKNYGHLFTYWDRLLGTYKSPLDCKHFNDDI